MFSAISRQSCRRPASTAKSWPGVGGATWFGCALGDNGAALALTSHSVVDQDLN
jgi:hypothetical protein